MQAGTLTTHCRLTAGVNTRFKPRCGKVSGFSDRLMREKSGYWYYKLQASEPIFPTKSGKMTRYKHLGASGTEAHIEALMQINRRNQLEVLSRTLDSLMQCWSDLYENSKSENQL